MIYEYMQVSTLGKILPTGFNIFRKPNWRWCYIQSSIWMHLKTTAMHLFMSVSIASGLIDHSTSTYIRCLNPSADAGIFNFRSYCSEKVHEIVNPNKQII